MAVTIICRRFVAGAFITPNAAAQWCAAEGAQLLTDAEPARPLDQPDGLAGSGNLRGAA